MSRLDKGKIAVADADTGSRPTAVAEGLRLIGPFGHLKSTKLETFLSAYFPLDRLQAWAVRGGVSILQQGLFAGSHFVVNVLLARWLPPRSYGALALAYSFFL